MMEKLNVTSFLKVKPLLSISINSKYYQDTYSEMRGFRFLIISDLNI
jgi:hypothetical protein